LRNPPVPRCRGPGLRDGAAAKVESRRITGRSPNCLRTVRDPYRPMAERFVRRRIVGLERDKWNLQSKGKSWKPS
jgi:hypothetical protein